MSTLTKVFVILLVLLSIVLTSFTVVFVNKADNFKQMEQGLKEQVATQEAKASAASAEAQQAKSDLQAARQSAQNALAQANQTLLSVQQQLADRDVKIAGLQNQIAMQSANLSQVTEALKTSEVTKAKTMDANTQFRADLDRMLAQNAQLNATVSDLTNKLEVTERERRFFQEQLTETQNAAMKLGATLKDLGVTPEQAGPGLANGAPPINGIIREVRTIANIPYATISVGSSDNVIKGMRFKIVDRDRGDFLGVITVDTVEPNEATGRLTGPRVSEVKAGNDVRTQL